MCVYNLQLANPTFGPRMCDDCRMVWRLIFTIDRPNILTSNKWWFEWSLWYISTVLQSDHGRIGLVPHT